MKYAKFSDDFLSDFRLDDNGETLVLTDKRGYTRAVKLLPYEERPKGKWLHPYITDIACECSFCHLQQPITDYFKFCPNCGAEMEGVEEEGDAE